MSAVCSHGEGRRRRKESEAGDRWSPLGTESVGRSKSSFFPSPNVARLHLRPRDKPVCGEQTRESRI